MKKRVFVLIMTLIFCFTAGLNALAASSPVCFWNFDEGAGNTVYNGTSDPLDGTAAGHTWVDGKYGAALSFSGTDKVTFGNGAIGAKLDGSSSVTIAMWVKRSATSALNFMRVFVTTTNAGLSVGSNATGVVLGTRSITGDTWQSKSFATGNFSLNEWHHVAGVFNFENKTLEAFLDGVSLGTQSVTLGSSVFTLGSPTVPDEIGGANMVVDNVTVFTEALEAEDISKLMEAGIEGSVKYYKGSAEQTVISSGDITSVLLLKNNSEQETNMVFLTVVFGKQTNIMEDFDITAVSVDAGEEGEFPLSVTVPADGNYYIESYMWNNMEEMATVIKSTKLE